MVDQVSLVSVSYSSVVVWVLILSTVVVFICGLSFYSVNNQCALSACSIIFKGIEDQIIIRLCNI